MRLSAPNELPKVRLCANLVLTFATGGEEEAVNNALRRLKSGTNRSWGTAQALQYLTGQQANFAIEAAPPAECDQLRRAQVLAKTLLDC